MKSNIINKGFNKFARAAKFFYVNKEKCNGCGICAENCPTSTISLVNGKPIWGDKCYQCLCCINYCPQYAIQYGKQTEKRGRYNIEKYLYMSSVNSKKEKSCGCIIIENGKVLLIQQTKGHWGFPKGHMEENETEIETAIREVKEETNLDVEIEKNKRYTIEYVTDKGKNKQVVLFIAKVLTDKIKEQEDEVKAIKWLSFNDAIQTITYVDMRELLKKILKEEKYLI